MQLRLAAGYAPRAKSVVFAGAPSPARTAETDTAKAVGRERTEYDTDI
jgi:hypothetical protein